MNEYPIFSIWTSRHACYEYDDYFSLMTAMGCHKKCPYCVVGHVQGYKSGRAQLIDQERILDLIRERKRRYGTRLIKLFFSSAFSEGEGDISSESIKELLSALLREGVQARVGSLNIQQADDELFDLLSHHEQDNVTFAPETIAELRHTINKGYIKDEKLHYLAEMCSKYDLDMTLYMLGCLPGETDSHTKKQAKLIDSIRKTLSNEQVLEVHYNQSFMKAQTPYQYFGGIRPEEIRRKFRLLKRSMKRIHDIRFVSVIDDSMSYYQPILASGDFNAGKVLSHLYKKRTVTEDEWKKAFVDLGLDDERYFTSKDARKILPWEHISFSTHENLKKRFKYYDRVDRSELNVLTE